MVVSPLNFDAAHLGLGAHIQLAIIVDVRFVEGTKSCINHIGRILASKLCELLWSEVGVILLCFNLLAFTPGIDLRHCLPQSLSLGFIEKRFTRSPILLY